MDDFPFMVECLRKFNYPLIHGMDEVQITEIFSNANRQFLVTWILEQIDGNYSPIVENTTREELANIIYSNGFCNASEKVLFMNAKCDSTKQFTILHKMLSRMKNVSSGTNVERGTGLSPEEQEAVLNFNTNLFPMYGNKKTFTVAEREKKIQDFKNEIEELRNSMDSKRRDPKTGPLDPNLKEQLITSMKQLEMGLPHFHRESLDVMKYGDIGDSEKIRFSADFGEKLEKFCEKIQSVSMFIKSMRLIADYEGNNGGVDKVEENNNNAAMMREIAALCREIAALKNENH